MSNKYLSVSALNSADTDLGVTDLEKTLKTMRLIDIMQATRNKQALGNSNI